MTEYYCKGSARLTFCYTLFVSIGGLAFVLSVPVIRRARFSSIGEIAGLTVPLALVFGGMACFGLFGLLETLAVYRLTEDGIVKRLWNGKELAFLWSELVQVERQRKSITLVDFRGRRMTLAPNSFAYRSRDGQDLNRQLEARLAAVEQTFKAQLRTPREFRAGDKSGVIAAGFMAVFVVTMAICVTIIPSSPPAPPAFQIGAPVVGALLALYFIYLGICSATRVITLTDSSITDRNFFRKREIPFADIQSITTKDVQGKSTTSEWTTLTSANTRIAFSDRMPNYEALVRALQPYVSEQVRSSTPQAIARDARRDRVQTAIGLLIVGILCGLGIGVVSLMTMNKAQDTLARQTALDTRGKQTSGEMIGTDTTGSKTMTYYLNFAFNVNGKRYSHFSSVTRSEYDQARMGEPVSVTYLPDDPSVSRIAQSLARETAEGQFHVSQLMLGAAILTPILLPLLSLGQKNRYHPDRKRA